MNNIVMMTKNEAELKCCPYRVYANNVPRYCRTDCMAWIIGHRLIEMEDHSGASLMMSKESSNRNYQEVKRKGPDGCNGILYLEEQGYCARIWINNLREE